MEYAIISAKVTNNSKFQSCVKVNELYPSIETTIAYAETGDKKILEKMYMAELKPEKKGGREVSPVGALVYNAFIAPFLHHVNMMIVCDEDENDYIDVLCKFLKDEYKLEVIDLNQLFTKGKVGPIHIDRDEVHDKAVDIRRAAATDQFKAMTSTKDGKAMWINSLSKKKKIHLLKKYGIDAGDGDNLDALLLEEWCREDGQWDED